MNLARTAYSSAAAPTRTPQGVEYDVFAKVTSRMKTSAARGRAAFPDLAVALNENRRLWLILANDVAAAGNSLPDQLRAQIVYLADFTFQHTTKVLGKQASVDALVDINTSVMRGLRQQEANR